MEPKRSLTTNKSLVDLCHLNCLWPASFIQKICFQLNYDIFGGFCLIFIIFNGFLLILDCKIAHFWPFTSPYKAQTYFLYTKAASNIYFEITELKKTNSVEGWESSRVLGYFIDYFTSFNSGAVVFVIQSLRRNNI